MKSREISQLIRRALGEELSPEEEAKLKESAEWREIQGIVDLARTTPPESPPDGFTETVLARIASCRPRRWSGIRDIFFGSRLAGFGLKRARAGAANGTECFFYMAMAGFFYLIVGIVLTVGFRKIGVPAPVSGWITLQPLIAFITAFGFLVLGIALLKKSILAVRTVYIGLLIYIGFVIINGLALQRALCIPDKMVVMLLFIGIGVMLGTFLGVIVQRYGKNFEKLGAKKDGYQLQE